MMQGLRKHTLSVLASLLIAAGFAGAQPLAMPVYAVDGDGAPTGEPVGYAELEDGDVVLEVELVLDFFDTSFQVEIDGRVFTGTLTPSGWAVTEQGSGAVGARVEFDDDPFGRDDDLRDDDEDDVRDDDDDDDARDDDDDLRDDDEDDDLRDDDEDDVRDDDDDDADDRSDGGTSDDDDDDGDDDDSDDDDDDDADDLDDDGDVDDDDEDDDA